MQLNQTMQFLYTSHYSYHKCVDYKIRSVKKALWKTNILFCTDKGWFLNKDNHLNSV